MSETKLKQGPNRNIDAEGAWKASWMPLEVTSRLQFGPQELPERLQDGFKTMQDASEMTRFQNRSESAQGPIQEASKSPRPSKKRPRGAQGPSKSSQERSKSPPRTLKCQTARLELRVHRVGSAGTAKRIQL